MNGKKNILRQWNFISVWFVVRAAIQLPLFIVLLQNEEIPEVTSELIKGSLNRAWSAQAINSTEMPAREDCLKRVSSEPLLSVQEKGALLKRKLSLLDQDVIVDEDGRNKLKKQGGKNVTTLIQNTFIQNGL